MKKLLLPLFTLVLGWLPLAASAALTIEITKGLSDIPTRSLSVMDFVSDSGGENLGQIIRGNLQRSGMFNMFSPDQLPAGITLAGFLDADTLAALPPEFLLRGSTTRVGDIVEFRYELFTRGEAASVLSSSFRAHHSRARDAAHFISDAVYEKITGLPGIFSTRIAYVNAYRRDGAMRYRLEIADIDGARRTVLLDSSEPIVSPAWAPGGRRLAYISFETREPQIYLHDLTNNQRQRITSFSGSNTAPAWSPDGRYLAMSLSKDGNPEIYIMDLQSRALTRVTNHPAIDTEPRWSADGQILYFTSDRSGTAQVYRQPLNSDSPRRITFSGRFNARADVSRNGQYLALVHNAGDGRYRIGVMNLDNQLFSTLTQNAMDDTPSFAPDSRLVVYSTRQGGGTGLRIEALDGRASWRIAAVTGDLRSPAWSPVIR